ncbi:MAG: nicotinamide riboside transporter PnuC [Fimbriimonadaceae bacterium]|nr:nicotinamide riboside transporter PnuC [Fimbriimonadaceae bacterium]QYK56285.1 MAG: nicotinamide riboside transporter PnuC [Fimbriimonadaceae bacterium]
MGRLWVGLGVALSAVFVWACATFPFLETGWAEAVAFVFAAWWIVLLVRQNVWNWAFAILSSLMYAYVFYEYKLFADSGLQFVYVALSILGWYWWLKGGEQGEHLRVRRTSGSMALGLAIFVAVATGLGYARLALIPGTLPFWDSLTTGLSLAGQFMQARKLYENWHLWIVTNCMYVAIYIYKGLELTSFLSLVLLGMCFAGLKEWRAAMKATG